MLSHKFEKITLYSLFIMGVISLISLIRKPPMKDWLIVFLFKGYISIILDKITVKKGYIKYPVKMFKMFDISFIFDYLLFPISCVYYNQLTYKSNALNTLLKVFIFSIPMTIVETWFERKTQLVKYKKGWNWFKTFSSLNFTFWGVRLFLSFIRKASIKQAQSNS